ncbi:response regulator, partial [bacterium]|nr:response regulator [bacterium]
MLVEDNPTTVVQMKERLLEISGMDIAIANSRDSAISNLETAEFDLIICDLKIPTNDGQLDSETEHGQSVVTFAQENCPGTPIVILSAFGTIDSATDAMRSAQRFDLVGDGNETLMVNYYTKDRIDACFEEIEKFSERLKKTDEIEIRRRGAGASLLPNQARVIKMFARSRGGQIVEVDIIPGGFSSTKKFKISVKDANGQLTGVAFAKIGPFSKLSDEALRFDQYVGPRLPIGSFTNLFYKVNAGTVRTGGLFYQTGLVETLFDILGRDQRSTQLIRVLADKLRPWHEGAPTGEIPIGELRRRV